MTYWIVVGSADNFRIAMDRGFDLFGFKSTRRKQSGEMAPGDKLVFYLTGIKKFGGIATVKSEAFEDHKRIFRSEKKPQEDYPFRVKTKADIIPHEDHWLDVPDYVPQLEFTKKGATKSWALHFQGNLHKISETDFKLLQKDLRAAARRKAGPSSKALAKPKTASKPKARAKAKTASKPKARAKAKTKARI